jgi:hypothetical protein
MPALITQIGKVTGVLGMSLNPATNMAIAHSYE